MQIRTPVKEQYFQNLHVQMFVCLKVWIYERMLINPLPDDKILDRSKLKKLQKNGNYVLYRGKNIVRKGEIACYKQFLLFSQSFPQLYIFSASKCGIV